MKDFVVKIETPHSKGTGFYNTKGRKQKEGENKSIITTANHVVDHAIKYREPIWITHHSGRRSVFFSSQDYNDLHDVNSDLVLIFIDETIFEFPTV